MAVAAPDRATAAFLGTKGMARMAICAPPIAHSSLVMSLTPISGSAALAGTNSLVVPSITVRLAASDEMMA